MNDLTEQEYTHIDNFIDYGSMAVETVPNENYARWILNHSRLPAIMKNAFDPFMKDHELFCVYQGNRYRITGASRLGGVWLTANCKQTTGYQMRVSYKDCSQWSPHPASVEIV